MVLIIIVMVLILTVVMIFMVRKMGKDLKETGDRTEAIGKSIERIEQGVHTVGKLFTALVIRLVKSSKEKRPLTGKDLVEGLKMVEESKTAEELIEKLSREQLPEGEKEEVKKEKSEEDTG